MIRLCFLICFFFTFTSSQQYYDQTLCFTGTNSPGTRYTCNTTSKKPCRSFFIYRANDKFSTLSNMSDLFRIESEALLSHNNNNNVASADQILEPGHEVLVPITCSCAGEFSQANFTYTVSENSTLLSDIACGIFQGLVKTITLAQENRLQEYSIVRSGSKLLVPLKCACPSNRNLSTDDGAKYLITYPLIKGDSTRKLSEKFNVSVEKIWRANSMDPNPTVFPYTTVLVPLRNEPLIDFDIPDSDPPSSPFLPTTSIEKKTKTLELRRVYIAGSVIGCCLVLALMVACGLYVRALMKYNAEKSKSSTRRTNSWSTPFSEPQTRSSTNSCLSPDLLDGIKYSVRNYTLEELKKATLNFCNYNKIGENLHKGSIENAEVMVKKTRFEGTRQIIDVHAKINHVNIAKLLGVCYEEQYGLVSSSFLVFEHPCNGSLRDCLSSESSSVLHWHRRTQIAFDIATGLHYLHNSVIHCPVRSGLNSRNVFLNANWRAKITVFGTEKSTNNWAAHEKVDIFSFGVVLLEIISGKEDSDGGFFRESMKLGVNDQGGCFDQLRSFVDPCLKDDYPLAEALCLAVLAASCVEDDPLRRPSMDDVLKVLARMV